MKFKDIKAPRKIIFGLKAAKLGFERKKYKKKSMGAAYIEGNKIIIASNDIKTHPMGKIYNSRFLCIHAEYEALRSINDASGGILFVYRERLDGTLGLARPCHGCQQLLIDKNVKRVIFTTENGYADELYYDN